MYIPLLLLLTHIFTCNHCTDSFNILKPSTLERTKLQEDLLHTKTSQCLLTELDFMKPCSSTFWHHRIFDLQILWAQHHLQRSQRRQWSCLEIPTRAMGEEWGEVPHDWLQEFLFKACIRSSVNEFGMSAIWGNSDKITFVFFHFTLSGSFFSPHLAKNITHGGQNRFTQHQPRWSFSIILLKLNRLGIFDWRIPGFQNYNQARKKDRNI